MDISSLYFIAFVSIALMMHLFQRSAPTTTAGELDSDEDVCGDFEPKVPFRAKFAAGPGVTVHGWPEKGGIYVLSPCFGVELEFLGLDRFRSTERPSESEGGHLTDEEAHCDKMRQLGAKWWKSERAYHESALDYPKLSDTFIRVGWPVGGGIWVLNTTLEGADKAGASAVQNAYSMDERCRVIQQLGGVFYSDPKECQDLDLP